jgi:hypothetical protein
MGAPTYTPLVENRREGGFVVWDPSDGMLTRERIILALGAGICIAGLVLAALLTGGVAVAAVMGVNTGNGTFGAIVAGTAAKIGGYVVEFDDATHFVVSDPSGVQIGHGTTGVAFAAGGLGFTITAGATAFVAGDSFIVTVAGTTKYVPYDPTSTTGAQTAAAVLWSGNRDATSADRRAVANVRGPMRVQASELLWGAGVTTDVQRATALAQLAKLGILSV